MNPFNDPPPLERRTTASDLAHVPPRRMFDADFRAYAVPVPAGGFYVTRAEDEMLVAVTASGMVVCARDPESGVGGMGHFLVPNHPPLSTIMHRHVLYFGTAALEKLFHDLAAMGAAKERLEIKIFGGASLLKNAADTAAANIAFLNDYLAAENCAVASHDVGGVFPRRIQYFSHSGKLFRLLMRRSIDAALFTREAEMRTVLRTGKAL